MGGKRWSFDLAIVAASSVALLWRVGYILLTDGTSLLNDGIYHHTGALLLADGEGWVSPYHALGEPAHQDAGAPPLWRLTMALPSVLGLTSILAHQLWAALLGTGAVALTGYAGRAVAGPRVGIVAAVLAAVYPGYWIFERELVGETLTLVGASAAILLTYRYLAEPTLRRYLLLAVAVGALALTRAEALLLGPLLLVPLALVTWSSWRGRAGRVALAAAVIVGMLLPWTAFNLSRFEQPVVLSNGFGSTAMISNCDHTYDGERLGHFDFRCFFRGYELTDDQARDDAAMREIAVDYVIDHAGDLPRVVLAREGRTFGLYRPFQAVDLHNDEKGAQRSLWGHRGLNDHTAGVAGLAPRLWVLTWWPVALAAVAGAWMLRRRGVATWPLVAPIVVVVLAVAITFGQPRYRALAEPSVVVLAASIAATRARTDERASGVPDATSAERA